MYSIRIDWALGLIAVLAFSLTGCPHAHYGEKPGSADDHGHEHHHHGPHNGELMELGNEQYHAEWIHDESGKVTVYILDSAAKKEVPIAADEITIDVKIGNNPPQPFHLTAVNPRDGKSAAFEITDKNFEPLFHQLKSTSVTLTLHVNIDGKQFDEPIKEHEHGHEH